MTGVAMGDKKIRRRSTTLPPDPQKWIMIALVFGAMVLLFGFGSVAGAVVCVVCFILVMTIF